MATLSDLMTQGSATSDRDAYLTYAEMCQLAGKQPLPFPKWIAAGKPAK